MVSIIICFYERLEYLGACLDSLQFHPEGFDEVVITDDGSKETTVKKLRELISKYDFPINYVWQSNKGFRAAAARNNGVRHARGDYLIFLDCDFLVLPGAIQQHLKAAKPRRFVVGHCKYLTEDQTRRALRADLSQDLIEDFYQNLPERKIIEEQFRFIKWAILLKLHLVSAGRQSIGGHFSIYRQDIERVNGYDENFVGWGGEDQDLGRRLFKAGIHGRSVIRAARVLHLWHSKEIGDKRWQEGPNIEYLGRNDIPDYCVNGLKKT